MYCSHDDRVAHGIYHQSISDGSPKLVCQCVRCVVFDTTRRW